MKLKAQYANQKVYNASWGDAAATKKAVITNVVIAEEAVLQTPLPLPERRINNLGPSYRPDTGQ
jgi:hypothetical protein